MKRVRDLVDRVHWENRGGMWVPPSGFTIFEDNISDTGANEGTTITASATPHAVGSTTQLIASTAFDVYFICVQLSGVGASTAGASMLVNIRIGAGSSETDLIPNLNASNSGVLNNVDLSTIMYRFPLFIPAGSRISANCQGSVASDTCVVGVILFGHPHTPVWAGTRVTAYGADTANSRGTSHTGGSAAYGTATQLSASTSRPIRYMQVARDGLNSTTLANQRGLIRIGVGSGPTWIVSGLLYGESNREMVMNWPANAMLEKLMFNIPAGVSLHVAAINNNARGYIVYGID